MCPRRTRVLYLHKIKGSRVGGNRSSVNGDIKSNYGKLLSGITIANLFNLDIVYRCN